jgi:para-aminobenzoate synthetase component I
VDRESFLPLVHQLIPAPDPWQVCRRLGGLPRLLFLDSANSHPTLGRYSFVTADPFAWLRSRRSNVEWTWLSPIDQGEPPPTASVLDPFTALACCLKRFPLSTIPGLPPFQGGAAGLFGYDLCHHLERLPQPPRDEFATPDLAVGLYDWVIAFDDLERKAWLISTGLPEQGSRRLDWARRRMEQVLRRLEESPPLPRTTASRPGFDPGPRYAVPGLPGVWSNFERAGFQAAIRRGIEYTHAGDCFQVNLSQRLLAPTDLPPLDLYARLRERNPAPFAGYFDMDEAVLLSASPERFLRVDAGEVESRPIKGTRPRGRTPEEDHLQAEELLRSGKDRAENVMIIDLLRNDLGRVCEYGSIRVPAVCRLESYHYVHHLVSEVRGRLRAGLGPIDLLRAAFPGGSVTGAPKVRAMEIIAELEPTARGPYCGSLAYLGFDGAMDSSILIRTFTRSHGWLQFPVGGGIVADSTPEAEYAETLHKAEGLLRALDLSV